MTHDPTRPLVSSYQSQTELDLFQLILDESIAYPWNPAEPESEAYFAALEQEVVEAGWSAEELAEQGQILSAHLEQLWTTAVPATAIASATEETTSHILQSDLFQQFTTRMPQQVLDGIVRRARQMMQTNLSMAEQLVQCVQDCLPNWGEEDLQVLARPFAYAMRGEETGVLEVALQSVRCADWSELSSIEQARLSLAIARYTLSQVSADGADS